VRLSPVRGNQDEAIALPQVQDLLSPLSASPGAGGGQEQYRQTADQSSKCHLVAGDARDEAVDGGKDPCVQPRNRPPARHSPHRTKEHVCFCVWECPGGNCHFIVSSLAHSGGCMQAVCLIGGRCSAVVDVDVCRRACRNSSHILPPGANVQRSVQPAAIAAAHHGHGPRSLPHTCDDHHNKCVLTCPRESRIEAGRWPRPGSRTEPSAWLSRMRSSDPYGRLAAAGGPRQNDGYRVREVASSGRRCCIGMRASGSAKAHCLAADMVRTRG
jgi:hypothetical protein